MAASTRSRVAGLTAPVSLSTAETVALETPACAATSVIVGRLPDIATGLRRRRAPDVRPSAPWSDGRAGSCDRKSNGTDPVRIGSGATTLRRVLAAVKPARIRQGLMAQVNGGQRTH